MHRSQVFLLRPNQSQAEYFARAAGIARFAYNWALTEWKRQAVAWWESGKQTEFPNTLSLQKQFNSVKRECWPWMADVSKLAPEGAIFAVGQAFDAFRAGQSRYPRFKAKGRAKESFLTAASYRDCRTAGRRVRLPIVGWVRLGRECRWPNARLIKAVVSRRSGKWYLAVQYEIEDSAQIERAYPSVGVDVGIKSPIKVAFSGATLDFGNGLRERLNVERRKLRRANKALHRRVKGSGRRLRARNKVARIQRRMSDIRLDFQHKATSLIAGMASRVGVETLNVKGMLRNGRLARHISDVGFFEIRRQLAYKADELVEADRFYPSSKTCSCCGSVKDKLTLSDRIFICEDCGFTCDRDENAARNLEKMAADRAVSARGDGSSARKRKLTLRSLSAKRESASSGGSEQQ